MKEFRRLKKDVVGKKLIIPYQVPMLVNASSIFSGDVWKNSVISLEFDHDTIYEFESNKDPVYDEECYKTYCKSYYQPVYLTIDIVNKYFMDSKEMHNEEFNEKMDKLLE